MAAAKTAVAATDIRAALVKGQRTGWSAALSFKSAPISAEDVQSRLPMSPGDGTSMFYAVGSSLV